MKTYKILFLGLVAAVSLSTLTALAVEQAPVKYVGKPATDLSLSYDIYAGGFDVMSASLKLQMKEKSYQLSLDSNTHNFIGKIFPWKGAYTTEGHPDKKGMAVPSKHVAVTTWKGTETRKQSDYDAAGNLTKLSTKVRDKTEEKTDISPDLYKDSVDLLTGMMMIIQNANTTNTCAGSFPVFDGKRRFDITLIDPKPDTLAKSKYSKFEGETVRCAIKVKPVGGFVKKDAKRGWMAVQAHTEERKHPPLVWFGRPDPKGMMVPVRMEIASTYGAVVAHLMNTPQKK